MSNCTFFLSRGGPFECHPELLSICDDHEDSDNSDFGSDRDPNSESDAEWETLPRNVDVPEVPTENFTIARSVMSTSTVDEPARATSLVSSAAASVAALWPWKKT